MTGVMIGVVALVLGLIGLCALFAWLLNGWMSHDEDGPVDPAAVEWTEEPGASRAEDP
jgi:hypothetical protein